jgi:aspartate/methionine/tyrosine aminotransferase
LKEQLAIAEIVKKYPNLVVICDEVYKFSVYDPIEAGDPTTKGHYHFAKLPGTSFNDR